MKKHWKELKEMNHQKMLDIMDEVNSEAVEREELTECIAL